MKRFKNILAVFNSRIDNRALFEHIVDLAARNKASITVVDIVEEATFHFSKTKVEQLPAHEYEPDIQIFEELPLLSEKEPILASQSRKARVDPSATTIPDIDIQEQIVQEEKDKLKYFAAKVQEAGLPITTKLLVGVPFVEIIREVLRNNHDLVVVTAEGKGRGQENLFGNTTMHLMRKCPCPVWVIKQSQTKQFGHILAAVDLDGDDENRERLAQKIMELSISLAQMNNSELVILNAWRLYGESILRGQGRLSNEEMEKILQETKEAQRKRLTNLLQKFPMEGLKYEAYLMKGDAGNLITEIVPAKSIDLIVMGTLSRTGLSGFLIGNTAEKVLHAVDSSVLTVKPEGFVSPVELGKA